MTVTGIGTTRRALLALVAAIVVAFGTGFGVATALQGGDESLATPQGVASLYRQVLTDLQQHYYKAVSVSRLGLLGINDLLKSLNDPYTEYFTPQQAKAFNELLSGTYSGIGVVVEQKGKTLFVTRVLPNSPAARAGMRAGDMIVSVDGKAVGAEPLELTVTRIQGPPGSVVPLQIRRAGRPALIDLSITRRELSFPLTSSRLIDDHGIKVGYVELSEFASGAGAAVQQAVSGLQKRGAQWLILDLRDNGGGLVDEAQKVASVFLPSGSVIVSTQGLHSPKEVLRAGGTTPTKLPLVVLVNGNTASSSEIVSGALQDDHRATLIGQRTFGKGVVQEVLPLLGGGSLRITVAAYRTPSGHNINHKGITPTIVVPASSSSSPDLTLRRALQFIVSTAVHR
jgi:carboxyl-terminal processing protease